MRKTMILAFLLAAAADAQETKELTDTAAAIAQARRLIPAAADATMKELETSIRRSAERAEIAIEIAPAPATSLPPSLELRRLDVRSRDELLHVQHFLGSP